MNNSSKISFDLKPSVMPNADASSAPQQTGEDAVNVSSSDMSLPPVFAASQPEPKAEPQWEPTHKPASFRRPLPKPPGFAATGLMAQQNSGFFKRNAVALGVSGGIVFTFILGLMTAFLLFGDRQVQQFSQSSAPLQETATRSVMPDMTGVSAVADYDAPPLQQSTVTDSATFDHTVLNSIKLRHLREGALAGLVDVVVAEVDGVRHVQLETINVTIDDGFGEGFLVEAAQNGLLELSDALRTPEGELDAKTVIFDVVQRSLLADGTRESDAAAHELSRKMFEASIARTQYVNGERIYTIQAGDSLAYIALQFFGMPGEYSRILDANRDTLQSPDMIQIGQRIIIPS